METPYLKNSKGAIVMRTLGNIIWFVFGLLTAIVYFISGIICCCSIIFISFGIKYFKLAGLALLPFKKTVDGCFEDHPVKNALWLSIGGGIGAWLYHSIIGVLLCITVIGIPFGKQNFKIAKYALRPYGATIEKL